MLDTGTFVEDFNPVIQSVGGGVQDQDVGNHLLLHMDLEQILNPSLALINCFVPCIIIPLLQ